MKTSKIFRGILILVAVIFIINQLISSLYMPIKTETAVFYTANDGYKITGTIIRDETLITSDAKGAFHFVTPDGNRVSKDGIIANIYTDESASVTVSRINALKDQIADIEDILGYNDIEAANLDLINTKISEKLNELLFGSSGGNYIGMDDFSEELLSVVNRKQAALGDTSGLKERLEALNQERETLSGTLPAAKGKITAQQSGYFVSKTDGYETVLTTGDLSGLTPEFLENVKPAETGDNVIGKIVSDYEWYIAATVSVNDSLKYKVDQELKILTSVKSTPELSVTVKEINMSNQQDKAVIVFACSDMNSELATLRKGVMTVVSKEYSGLKVSKKALRVVDSVRGVYVQNGMQVNFVPVEILYDDDAIIICEKKNDSDNCLKLYDKVVVKGKNLYDGKIIG